MPMSSLTEAKAVAKCISKRYPNKRVKLYSSETPLSEKREHFGNVNLHWAQYDVLIYTPTVSAGISFEQQHFTKIFGYFVDLSCPAETCQQMIGRIRSVASGQFFICLSATGAALPTELDDIRTSLYRSRERLVMNMDNTLLSFEYGPNCEIKYHNGDYFHMWLENTRMRNLSRNYFIQRMIGLVACTGAALEHLTNEVYTRLTGAEVLVGGELTAELTELSAAHENARLDARSEVCATIAQARELTEAEVESIQNRIIAQQDLTADERWSYEKYKLRADYNYWPRDDAANYGTIDESFVEQYRDPKVRRMFRNLSRIGDCDSIESALQRIQSEERANYLYVMNHMDDRAQNLDVSRKYVFDQHRLALGLLKACGWNSINDPRFIVDVVLAENIQQHEQLIVDNLGHICTEFHVKRPKLEYIVSVRTDVPAYIAVMLSVINRVLMTMYGIKIATRGEKDMFVIVPNTLFGTDPAEDRQRPIIPRRQ